MKNKKLEKFAMKRPPKITLDKLKIYKSCAIYDGMSLKDVISINNIDIETVTFEFEYYPSLVGGNYAPKLKWFRIETDSEYEDRKRQEQKSLKEYEEWQIKFQEAEVKRLEKQLEKLKNKGNKLKINEK